MPSFDRLETADKAAATTTTTAAPRTLYDKLFDSHVVDGPTDGAYLLFIDRHLVHEVTSPQAFEGLRLAKRRVRRRDCTLATVDHNIPTTDRKTYRDTKSFVQEPDSRLQCLTLEENVKEFGLTFFGLSDKRQGIVHIVGPEQGFTQPGTTIVCGDSHTSTHGAFGSLAFGIGTSEVEHVLATQTIVQKRARNMRISIEGVLPPGATSKDIILHTIGVIGTAGGTGCVVEFAGSAVQSLSMEARMSICNMSVEGGAKAGMIAPDETTYEYLKGRPLAPKGKEWDDAVAYWRTLPSDPGAVYDVEVEIKASDIVPTVSWGTSPQDVIPITGIVPDPAAFSDPAKQAGIARSLKYMGLEPNIPIEGIKLDKVFIGSCTNARIEDLRAAAHVVHGRRVAAGLYAMVVPGSGLVKRQAEAEGLDKVFKEAGFDWREAGCSMCLGMNPDQLVRGERCASTSNRNFEGRQGPGGRTHLMSPAMAAAAAVTGQITDVRKLLSQDGSSAAKSQMKITVLHDKDLIEAEQEPLTQAWKPADAAGGTPAEAVAAGSSAPDAETVVAEAAGGMPPFTTLKAIAAPMDIANVDTDMIIPKQFLKTIKRSGLSVGLFYEMRFDQTTGAENPDFVLNREPFRQAKILVAGQNFGCGSSREHAPWALLDFGIRCIIAPSFADIHYTNLAQNGMLAVVLPKEQVAQIMQVAAAGQEVAVDLPKQTVSIVDANGTPVDFHFTIDAYSKEKLVKGLDSIGETMQKLDKISAYEEARSEKYPWLDGLGHAGTKNGTGAVRIVPKATGAGGLTW